MSVILKQAGKTVSQLTVGRIKKLIARSYDVGDILPAHRELAAHLSVSHTAVTEAMKTLSKQRIVNPVRRKGTVVMRRPSPQVSDLSQIAFIPKSSLGDLFRGYRGQMLSGVGAKVEENGMNLVLFPRQGHYGGAAPKEEVMLVADGLVLEGLTNDKYVADYVAMGLPMVCMDHYSPATGVDSVVCDNFGAGHRVVNYLAELGHKRISYVRQSTRISSDSDNVERLEAFDNAVYELGLSRGLVVDVNNKNLTDDNEPASSIIDHLRHSDNPSTAFVVSDDATADWLIGVLQDSGFRVPDDISVIIISQSARDGFRNIPRVSGCIMNFREIGVKAIETLERRCLEPNAEPFLVRVGYDFVPGYTCKAI